MTTTKQARAVSVSELMKKKFQLLPFEGKWLEHIGRPELSGSAIIWGNSGHGKSSYMLQLCKELAKHTRILYNALEEGAGPTMQRKFFQEDMGDVRKKLLLVKESMPQMIERLKRRKSPRAVIIDSVQYTHMKYQDYTMLKDRFPDKLMIFISHAKGKDPAGNTADRIRYDAHIKVYIEGFRAFPSGRYEGREPYTIWEQGASDYWINHKQNL